MPVRVLWAIAALLAAGVTALLVVDRHGPRDDVSAYIAVVNDTTKSFVSEYAAVRGAYASFSVDPRRARRQLPRLRAASAKLTALRVRVQRIAAPPAARRLRQRLLAYFRQQEAVARELVQINVYSTELARARGPLLAASTRLRQGLRDGRTPAAQADALAGYGRAVDRHVAALRSIEPPPIFAGSLRAQIARLRASSRALDGLRAALLANDRAAVDRAVAELRRAGLASPVSERRAILSYNRHVNRIAALAAAVERERRRLEGELG